MATSSKPAHTEGQPLIRFGEFQLDLQTGELSSNGTKNRLQGQPLQLLELLLLHRGQLVTREQIQQHLWPDGTVVEFEHSVNAAVKRLREALGDDAEKPTFIETIPRRGYRFIARVEHGAASTSAFLEERAAAVPPLGPTSASWRKRPFVVTVGLAAFLIVATLATWRVFSARPGLRESHPAGPRIKSLAVLPLKNLSGDSAQEYLADGMTEALIGRLSGIRGLRVISRTSVMRFKNTSLLVPEIAKTLGVDAIVEGSLMRDGDRIRVHAQLIRGATDEHFWSETYDQELRDVLALQSEVAQSIAQKVEVTITGEERARLVAARPVAPDVYESYLKGEFGKHNNRPEIEESIVHFEDALRRDPTFAPAYVGLAEAYDGLGTVFVGVPPGQTRPKVISAARKALELDPGLADAHVLLANVYQRQWKWAEAESEYKRALELKPNSSAAHLGFANWLMCQGRTEEALAWAQRGRELDPLASSGSQIGWILYHTRRYDDAIRELRTVLAVHPDDAMAHWFLGFVLIDNGQPEEAIPELEKAVSLSDRGPGAMGVLIRAYARAGRRADAVRLLAELKKRKQTGYVPAGAFVNAYLGLGDYPQLFDAFERAYQEQSNILQFLKVHPFFDPLRGDPRFKDLLRRVGLDQLR
jgi:TolB-like protein/DNA-binding winged helix-turn-helix (wHTH) protein/Flp pilus assembly protein TadD